jgi:nucleotide-binding universal stress UspA family protein
MMLMSSAGTNHARQWCTTPTMCAGSARHARHLATSAEPPSAGEFAKAAEETLEDLQDRLEEAGLDEDLDISYAVRPPSLYFLFL